MAAMHNLRVGLASLAAFFAVALLAPAMGRAATGDITFSGCIADAGASGCADPFQDPLNGARAVAVSPDGSSVYAASFLDNSISHFTRAANGSIGFAGCVANAGASGCADPLQDALTSASDVAVSPDGSSVYVTAATTNSISHFTRAANGSIDFAGCIADGGGAGCTNPFQDPLEGASAVAVSPDGSSVYVVSTTNNSISHFTRAANGSIDFAGCIADGGDSGCTDPFQDPLAGATDVAISPDGSSVYVTSQTDASISHFTRAANGSLSFSGCIADGGGSGCADPIQDSLSFANHVAVSPDGSSVYVTSLGDNSISHFARAANGSIGFAGCIADNGASGCADPFQDPLAAPRGVAVSPDGSSVYVASISDDSISHFTRAANGSIGFAGCVADDGASGCADPFQDPLGGASAVAVSPDGSSVYVTSGADDSISHFTRELPPPPTDPPAPTPTPTPTPTPAADTDPPGVTLSAKKVDAGKPISVTVACDEACSVVLDGTAKPKGGKPGGLDDATAQLAAGASQALKLKPSAKLKRKLRNAGKGRAAVEAVATDAAGNRGSDSENVKLK